MQVSVQTKSAALCLQAEVAATAQAREIGLMNRTTIGKFDGMIFLFPSAEEERFWMKNTHIPLDIIFIDAQGAIVKIYAYATPESLEPLPSGKPVTAVLEIAGGRAAKTGIHEGDTMKYDIPTALHVE